MTWSVLTSPVGFLASLFSESLFALLPRALSDPFDGLILVLPFFDEPCMYEGQKPGRGSPREPRGTHGVRWPLKECGADHYGDLNRRYLLVLGHFPKE